VSPTVKEAKSSEKQRNSFSITLEAKKYLLGIFLAFFPSEVKTFHLLQITTSLYLAKLFKTSLIIFNQILYISGFQTFLYPA